MFDREIEKCAIEGLKWRLRRANLKLGGRMSEAQRERKDENEVDAFLRYSAALTHFYVPSGVKGSRVRIRPRFAYAMMAGLNRFLRGDDVEIVADSISMCPPIPRSRLKRTVTDHARWVGSDAQFTGTLQKFVEKGFVASSSNGIVVTTALLKLLLGHAQTCYKNRLHVDYLPEWPCTKDWLELNEIVFDSLFYGASGVEWRKLRDKINSEIANQKGVKPGFSVDYIGDNQTYWVVVNIVALRESVTEWDLHKLINEVYGLDQLSGSIGDVATALRDLKAYQVFKQDDGALSLSPEYSSSASNYRLATVKGMQALRVQCEAWDESGTARSSSAR